ncbi:hypothetical protein [Tessaracoccus caeni]|uniref:hypothetical protein n=1 Tax=Tessaracoccus caeni TaxID=3031239 RepID=UPI0023DC00BC|nr:hypothetical protein [Tessaracoccus caeni]MDF1488841.1 hypothetical protein [Tessaracoccus caeni]
MNMPLVADYPTYSRARAHLKDVLDATARGRTVTLARDGELSAVMPVHRLRDYLYRTLSPRIRVLSEDGRVIALMEDHPFVSEGPDVDGALADLLLSLREYAEDWEDHLKDAPNHADAWALVQLVKLSTDDELRDWFERGGE